MNHNPLHIVNDGGNKVCQLHSPGLFQCCCNCQYRVAVHHHCCTEPKPDPLAPGSCQCGVQKGWACVGFANEGRVYDNWAEHSCGCELYEEKKPNEGGQRWREACWALDIDYHGDLNSEGNFTEEQLTRLTRWLLANGGVPALLTPT